MMNMKSVYFLGLLLCTVNAIAEFKIYQFEKHEIPRIDGEVADWAMVPESYAVGSDRLKDTLRGTKNDPANLDVSVKVGWVKGLNRLYFLYEAYDDYWDFRMPGMHNDILEVMVDGNASGGPITAIADPAVKYGSWEGYLMQGVQAQNYHIFTPSVGKNWAMIWGCQPWALEFPWSNAAQSYFFKHGESGRYTLEFWITPFDHAPIDGPEKAVVSELKEGAEIGLSWVVLDYDDEAAGKNGYRSFNNLSRETGVHSNADFLRRFKLMPLENKVLEAKWSFKLLDRTTRKVAFRDESGGEPQLWHWDFGDGFVSTNQHPVHFYKDGGCDRVVTLTVEGKSGSDSFSRIWEICLP
ncbi:PKD domain-containing protein [Pontiellaceae bacterium B12227]|nr:PKD domain-containing protein [Pontiellaceae bacterium B12227]